MKRIAARIKLAYSRLSGRTLNRIDDTLEAIGMTLILTALMAVGFSVLLITA